MKLIGSHINSSRFDFNPDRKEFVAEISELSHAGQDVLGRLFADSGDQGFVMVSAKTGTHVAFELYNREVNDGDVVFWEFRPSFADRCCNPKLRDVRVTVLND